MRALAVRKSHLLGCAWFWAWALIGAAAGLGALSLGPLLLLPAAVAALAVGTRSHGRGAFGLLTGAGSILLAIAYVQRHGPGTTCWHTATGGGCDQHLNPLPFLVAGVLCFAGGLIGHAAKS